MIFAFYGTLRAGQYNHARFGLDKIGKPLGTHVIEGYKMVDLNGWYPKVYPSDKPEDKITIELIQIEDKRTCDYIEMMEVGAGYEAVPITVDNTTCNMYVATGKMPSAVKVIPSGDWVEYDTKLKNGVRSSKV